MNKDEEEINWNELTERFYFLPEGGYAAISIAYPFALYRGIPTTRTRAMFNRDKPKPEEHEILKWTYEIGSELIKSLSCLDASKSNIIMERARKIASKYLEEDAIDEAIYLSILAWQKKITPGSITKEDLAFISMVNAKRGINIKEVEIIIPDINKN